MQLVVANSLLECYLYYNSYTKLPDNEYGRLELFIDELRHY